SPAVMTSRRLARAPAWPSAASASCCNAIKGRNTLSTACSVSRRTSLTGSRRRPSGISTSVPPAPHVANISWKDTSKLSEANWSVGAQGRAPDLPAEQVDQGPLPHGDPLRLAGGARRVHHVNEVVVRPPVGGV